MLTTEFRWCNRKVFSVWQTRFNLIVQQTLWAKFSGFLIVNLFLLNLFSLIRRCYFIDYIFRWIKFKRLLYMSATSNLDREWKGFNYKKNSVNELSYVRLWLVYIFFLEDYLDFFYSVIFFDRPQSCLHLFKK